MTTNSNILAWKSPWTEEPDGLQYIGSQWVGHDWVTKHTHRKEKKKKSNKLRDW